MEVLEIENSFGRLFKNILMLYLSCRYNIYAIFLLFLKSMYYIAVPNPESNRSYITTDGQSASLSWCQAPIWGPRLDFCYCQTVMGFLMWGGLSDQRTGSSFTIAVGARQRSHSRVRIMRDT
jgi:hypothetical protein